MSQRSSLIDQVKTTRAVRGAVFAAAVLSALWLGGAAAAPWIESQGGHAWGLRWLYSPLCHQMPERSLDVGGLPMALCARCTGLSLGAFLGLLAGTAIGAWMWRAPRTLLAIAIAPTAIDFALGFTQLPALAELPRAVAATPAGFVLGWVVAHGLGVAVMELRLRTLTGRPAGASVGQEE